MYNWWNTRFVKVFLLQALIPWFAMPKVNEYFTVLSKNKLALIFSCYLIDSVSFIFQHDSIQRSMKTAHFLNLKAHFLQSNYYADIEYAEAKTAQPTSTIGHNAVSHSHLI